MRKTMLPLALSALCLACGGGPGPEETALPEVPRYSIEEFLATTNVYGASFSPDASKVLVSSNESGIYNAYAIPTDGGEPVQLTHSTTDAVGVTGYFPHDERFLFLSDQGGNELHHLYVRDPDGTTVDLTPGDGHKAVFIGWAHDDESFFVVTNERDPRFFDVYEVAADGYARTLFYQDDVGLLLGGVSPDERYLVFEKPITTSDSDVYLYDRQGGEMTNLTAHEGRVTNHPQAFSADGKSLYFTTDQGSEFLHLVRHDLASGGREEVYRTDWDVDVAKVSRDGRFVAVTVNRDGRNQLLLFRLPGMEPVDLPDLPGLDVTTVNFSRDARHLALYASTPRTPSNLYVWDLESPEPRRLTQTLNPAIDPEHLVAGRVVRFASVDGVEVPGVLYQPHGASPESRVPALVLVHGGPGGQSKIGYSSLTQYLVNHGYAVFAINNRGSSGYGKTFYRMDDRAHGEGDLGDCVASKEMLAATGWVDAERIGILGGSYGGYMVLAALAFRPEEFAVGVDIFGVSNWLRTLQSIPPWWESIRLALYEEMGDPAADPEYLRRISPLFHAENIRRPLIVLQGANDPRVLKVESDEIVEAVRANGVPVEYLVFDDEGHGFEKKENQAEGYRAVREFLDRHLKGEPAAEGAAPAAEAG